MLNQFFAQHFSRLVIVVSAVCFLIFKHCFLANLTILSTDYLIITRCSVRSCTAVVIAYPTAAHSAEMVCAVYFIVHFNHIFSIFRSTFILLSSHGTKVKYTTFVPRSFAPVRALEKYVSAGGR